MKLRMKTMSLKTRAMLVTAGVLLLVVAVNTTINIFVATNKYRDALIARTIALAERSARFWLP